MEASEAAAVARLRDLAARLGFVEKSDTTWNVYRGLTFARADLGELSHL